MALACPTEEEAKGWLSLGSTPSICHHHRIRRTLCGPGLVSAPPSNSPTSTLGISTDIFFHILSSFGSEYRTRALSVASSLTNHHCASHTSHTIHHVAEAVYTRQGAVIGGKLYPRDAGSRLAIADKHNPAKRRAHYKVGSFAKSPLHTKRKNPIH